MKAWLASLEPRERLLLYATVALLGVILLYLIVIHPLHSRYDQLVSSVEEQRATLQWMQQSAAKVRQLRSISPAAAAGLGGRSLLSVTDSSARAADLGPALKRVEPEGSNGVRVWLDNAAFDSFIGWLDVMASRYGADVDAITLERAEAVGRINARVTLLAYQP